MRAYNKRKQSWEDGIISKCFDKMMCWVKSRKGIWNTEAETDPWNANQWSWRNWLYGAFQVPVPVIESTHTSERKTKHIEFLEINAKCKKY